jgi:hypothetical protein
MRFWGCCLVLLPYFDYEELAPKKMAEGCEDYLLVLSASPQINRSPVRSYVEVNIPLSASSEPGWAVVSSDWNL